MNAKRVKKEKTLPEGIRAGDMIAFGHYPQYEHIAISPVIWQVLEVSWEGVFIVSRSILECRPFHTWQVETPWPASDLRRWLNGCFLETAFSNDERKLVVPSRLLNYDNPEYGTKGGAISKDKVFCLSIEEARQYEAVSRFEGATYHVRTQGSSTLPEGVIPGDSWWLRTPGLDRSRAMCLGGEIAKQPKLQADGLPITAQGIGVRPALRLKPVEDLEDYVICHDSGAENEGEKAAQIAAEREMQLAKERAAERAAERVAAE